MQKNQEGQDDLMRTSYVTAGGGDLRESLEAAIFLPGLRDEELAQAARFLYAASERGGVLRWPRCTRAARVLHECCLVEVTDGGGDGDGVGSARGKVFLCR